MDPVTACGLAPGVLQVVDFSFRALKKCREIYKDGSLAEHRNTAELVRHLADTTDRLRATVDRTPRPISLGHDDIFDLSMKCSETATALLTELEKLKVRSGVSFLQAVSKSVRAIRRRGFIDQVQRKLDKYQMILDTRILVELNSQSIQQRDDFQKLDQNVRDLVIAMNQGRDTVARLLADHGLAIRNHIDQGLDSYALKMSRVSAQQQFKDSLFFPEMFSRQDHIAEEHQGTYRWIFQPPHDGESQEFEGGPAVTGKGNDMLRDEREARDKHRKGQQGSNFVAWLEHGKEIYWLNGKPGSGKSTLMKFITSNIWENAASKKAMVKWAGDNDVVTASFHFWTLGSTGLQKSLQGLLRSLLYQIASQQQDLIPILMRHPQHSALVFETPGAATIYEWTERRLRCVLQHFLDHKPSSVSLCILIDGLDEMIGDVEVLIDILRLLNNTPRTKLCVSSRPEQIFRQGFSGSPQIRLQDLNHEDIEKTATEELLPTLKECFPHDEEEICRLIQVVIFKAEGVFLWLELVIKDIKRGARLNADSLLELGERLNITPSSIDGLYEQMLDRLDKVYLREAGNYFRFLMADRTFYTVPTTLVAFVCAESLPWDHVRGGNTAWFQSPNFSEMCQHVEIRLVTRCAGLVEVEQQSSEVFRGTTESTTRSGRFFYPPFLPANQEERSVCCQLREVKFIHRSAMDFLRTHRPEILQDRDGRSTAELSLLRGTSGVLSIMPIVISETNSRASIAPHVFLIMHFLASYAASRASSEKPALESVAVEIVDDIYQIIDRVDASFNVPDHHWYEHCKPAGVDDLLMDGPPFRNAHGFAAFLGFRGYVSYHRSLCSYSSEETNYLLACTMRGLTRVNLNPTQVPGYCALSEDLLCRGADPNFALDVRNDFPQKGCVYTISVWGFFLYNLVLILPRIEVRRSRRPFVPNDPTLDQVIQYFKALVESYLSHGADVNTSISDSILIYITQFDYDHCRLCNIGIKETPLSYLKRVMKSKKHQILSPLVNLLRSQGAIERTRFHLVSARENGEDIRQVSEEESQRMCEVWLRPDGDPNLKKDSTFDVFLELKASLTKHDISDETIFHLGSSW